MSGKLDTQYNHQQDGKTLEFEQFADCNNCKTSGINSRVKLPDQSINLASWGIVPIDQKTKLIPLVLLLDRAMKIALIAAIAARNK